MKNPKKPDSDPSCQVSKRSFSDELEDRLIDFAVRIIKLSARLPKTPAGRHCWTDPEVWHFPGTQLWRSERCGKWSGFCPQDPRGV